MPYCKFRENSPRRSKRRNETVLTVELAQASTKLKKLSQSDPPQLHLTPPQPPPFRLVMSRSLSLLQEISPQELKILSRVATLLSSSQPPLRKELCTKSSLTWSTFPRCTSTPRLSRFSQWTKPSEGENAKLSLKLWSNLASSTKLLINWLKFWWRIEDLNSSKRLLTITPNCTKHSTKKKRSLSFLLTNWAHQSKMRFSLLFNKTHRTRASNSSLSTRSTQPSWAACKCTQKASSWTWVSAPALRKSPAKCRRSQLVSESRKLNI